MVWESEVQAFHLKANGYLTNLQRAMLSTFQEGKSIKIWQFGHPRTDGHFVEFGFNFLIMTHHSSTSKHPSSVPGTHTVLLAHFSTRAL